MIDLHCHLLPGIDDGPATIADSLALAEAFVAATIDTVAATPHVNDRHPNSAAAIAAKLTELHAALAENEIPLRVVPGAEIDLRYGLALDDGVLRELALDHGPWLLIEAPHQLSPHVDTAILELTVRGHRILLAHPERSPVFLRDPAALQRLVDAGVRTQITAGSLVGRFGGTVQRYAESLLRTGLVHVVASDAHDTVRRPPGLHVEQLRERLHDGQELLLTEQTPRTILAGGEPPAAVAVVRQPPRWRARLSLRQRERR